VVADTPLVVQDFGIREVGFGPVALRQVFFRPTPDARRGVGLIGDRRSKGGRGFAQRAAKLDVLDENRRLDWYRPRERERRLRALTMR